MRSASFSRESSDSFRPILAEEVSRLTSRPGTLINLLEDLEFRDQFLVTTQGDDSGVSGADLVFLIKGHMSKDEIKRIAVRTFRGLRERAEKRCSAGGLAYGYLRPRVDPRTGEKEVRKWHQHQPDPETAPVVVEIFHMYANGLSPRAIAAELNDRGIPSPGSYWNRKVQNGKPTNGLWRASSIQHMLENDIYRGKLIWNKTQWKKVPGTNKRRMQRRPKGDWKIRSVPQARIVDDLLWIRVEKRLADVRAKHEGLRRALKQKCGPGRRAKHLLSGILQCESCGSNFVIRDGHNYMCASQCNGAKKKGCDNTARIKKVEAEQIVLDAVSGVLLSDKEIDKALKAAVKKVDEDQVSADAGSAAVTRMQNRVADIEKQMGNLADAIATSGFTTALQAKYEELAAEHEAINRKIEQASSSVAALPKQQAMTRKALDRLRQMLRSIPTAYSGAGATPERQARIRSALQEFLGAVPINRAGEAVLQPALYKGGSGGRI